jgi:hypothetical protein
MGLNNGAFIFVQAVVVGALARCRLLKTPIDIGPDAWNCTEAFINLEAMVGELKTSRQICLDR